VDAEVDLRKGGDKNEHHCEAQQRDREAQGTQELTKLFEEGEYCLGEEVEPRMDADFRKFFLIQFQ
jgi:hypothetical protein